MSLCLHCGNIFLRALYDGMTHTLCPVCERYWKGDEAELLAANKVKEEENDNDDTTTD